MNLEIDRRELNYLIDGVAEELNQIEKPVAFTKAMLEINFLLEKDLCTGQKIRRRVAKLCRKGVP